MKYEVYFKPFLQMTEEALNRFLPTASLYPHKLHEAMRYAVFSGGKRFRAVLTLASCEALGRPARDAVIPACALELIHSYSLVQDDLPALDNDALRRGKPTCHKKYDEATAILASDGLLTLAFQILARFKPAGKAIEFVEEISTSSGSCGMIGGQAADLELDPAASDIAMLDYISIHKTGKLIKAGSVCGAIAAGAGAENRSRMLRFGEFIGLAFQSVDDMLDGDGYLHQMKAREVEENVRDLIAKAKREIKPLGERAEKLHFLADFLIQRIPRGSYAEMDS